MPGLIEYHSHLQKDFGEAQGRAWLAFGITTVRSPGNTPYEAVEDREANEAGVRPGPRVYGTGYLMEWLRIYYKMGIAISSPAQFEMELQRAKVLQHDLLKSYVRLPGPAAEADGRVRAQHRHSGDDARDLSGGVRRRGQHGAHSATSRRGYSPKMATLQRSYEDVIQLFGKSGRILCPMIPTPAGEKLFEMEPGMRQDPRFKLYPEWMQEQVITPGRRAPATRRTRDRGQARWCWTS